VGHDHDNQQNKTKGKVHWMPEINGAQKKKTHVNNTLAWIVKPVLGYVAVTIFENIVWIVLDMLRNEKKLYIELIKILRVY